MVQETGLLPGGKDIQARRADDGAGGFTFTPQSDPDLAHLARMCPHDLAARFEARWDGRCLVFRKLSTRPLDHESMQDGDVIAGQVDPFAALSLADLRTLATEKSVPHDSRTSRVLLTQRLLKAGVTPPEAV